MRVWKIKPAIAASAILVALLGLTYPMIAQEQQPRATSQPLMRNEEDALLARVASQEGVPTSPELKSRLDRAVTLGEFGQIAYRAPLSSTNTNATPIVLFHSIFGGVSHRDFRELLDQLDQSVLPFILWICLEWVGPLSQKLDINLKPLIALLSNSSVK
jgi:hypothetical protein